MKEQLSLLQQLILLMDPELYAHLDKADSLNLFFCFRRVLFPMLVKFVSLMI